MKTNINIDNSNLGELLKSYYQGKLSGKELEEFEVLKSQDEFLADATEGFDEFPEAIGNIPTFQSKNWTKTWIALGGLTILSVAAILFFNSPNSEIENTTVAQVVTENIDEEKEEIIEIVKPETTEKEIIVPITKIKPKKEITPKQEPNTKIDEEVKPPKRDFFEIPKMELNPIEIKQKTDYTVKKAKTKALLYYDFLAIDYSVIYTNTIPVKYNFSGVDASKANEDEIGVETGNGSQQLVITYKQQLKRSLFQLKNHNYSSAIQNFDVILKHFPQDANAEFYIGYSLFHQENYEKAIPFFEKAMANGFDFFKEDAEWFIANSLENMGKMKEAQVLYQKIKKEGGYYSYQVR